MKRLVVCCDGTWNTPDQEHDEVPIPTNVVRLYNAVEERGPGNITQLRYYHPGVGTEGNWLEKLAGGSGGAGLGLNVLSAYRWLAGNYETGDRIFLFGFSRGAYTVRSVSGMMSACGLLNLAGIDEKEAWSRVTKAYEECYRVKPSKRTDGWKDGLTFHSGDAPDGSPAIFFLGVWDTVGALGIPDDLALLNLFDPDRKHNFHDTRLGANVTHARHAVALDERRASFSPTLWTNVAGRANVKQIWFPGVHCDVGGGYERKGLSDGALKWMADEAGAPGIELALRADMLAQIQPNHQDVLHNSCRGFFQLLPTHPRSIPPLYSTAPRDPVHESAWNRIEHPPITQAVYHPTTALQPKQEKTCSIYACEPWCETGLYLEAGVAYTFTATGEWLDRNIPSGPSGNPTRRFKPSELARAAGTLWGKVEMGFKWLTGNENADFKGTKRFEKWSWFCLLGSIANGGNPSTDGTPVPHETFRIGDSCTYTPERSGYLFCFANDAWNFYGNNRGSVTLKVRRG